MNELVAVSCTSRSFCVAVGDSNNFGLDRTLVERWDGHRWMIQNIPRPTAALGTILYGVSCSTVHACVAVGTFLRHGRDVALVERWDGREWRLQRTPGPQLLRHVVLKAVSCPSASACVAAGYSAGSNSAVTLAERWDGRRWKVQRTPNGTAKNVYGNTDSGLHGVSCTSPSRCTSVGNSGGGGYTLAERWNGHQWKIQSSPNPAHPSASQLDAVSCGSAGDCVALGDSYDGYTDLPLVEHWSNSTWTIQSTPATGNGVSLLGVACSSAHACTAVGDNGLPLAERWNGTAWRIQRSASRVKIPDPGDKAGSGLNAVSCPSQNTCIAVGSSSLNSGGRSTLAESWHGS